MINQNFGCCCFQSKVSSVKRGLIRRRIKSNSVTAAEMGSTQVDYKEIQSTCQAGTGIHYGVHTCRVK